MKLFTIWAGITLTIFGLLGGSYHFYLTNNPRRVLIVVDTSFAMQSVWRKVPDIVEHIAQRPYAQFSLVTEKVKFHDWSTQPKLKQIAPFAPRNFKRLKGNDAYTEIARASEIHFITNAGEKETRDFDGWIIHRLNP